MKTRAAAWSAAATWKSSSAKKNLCSTPRRHEFGVPPVVHIHRHVKVGFPAPLKESHAAIVRPGDGRAEFLHAVDLAERFLGQLTQAEARALAAFEGDQPEVFLGGVA